jgi:hypothetical protein
MTFLDRKKDENNGIMECWNIGILGLLLANPTFHHSSIPSSILFLSGLPIPFLG